MILPPYDLCEYFLMSPGIDPIKNLQRKFYATLFLSILIGWKYLVSNQNAWKNSVADPC